MQLPTDLVAEFAKLTAGSKSKESETKTLYGTISKDGKSIIVDGSDGKTLTPIADNDLIGFASTVSFKPDDRVSLEIKDHRIVVTGNITDKTLNPNSTVTYKTGDEEKTTTIGKLDVLISEKIYAEVFGADNIFAEKLKAVDAEIDTLKVKNVEITDDLTAANGEITNLKTQNITITGDLEAANGKIEHLEAAEGDFRTLESDYAEFTETTTAKLEAGEADIKKIKTDKLDVTWANIDYSNIDKAVLEEFYASTGLIENVVIQDGSITGHLVGVTIRGDLIETNTLVADKLVIKGEDGIFYKLNFEAGNFTDAEEVPTDGLHGSVIVAKSITAEKVNVTDLVAFDATIGGFHITDDALYSGVKATIDNSTRGTYLGSDGQFAFGDATNFIKFYKVTNENGEDVLDDEGNPVYKLDISADSILFGDGVKSSAADIKTLTEHVKIGTIVDPDTGDEKPCVELAEGDTSFKQVITNTKTLFMDGSNVGTEINTDGVHTDNLTVDREIRHSNKTGSFVWAFRANGNYGLSWKKDVSS